MSEVVTLVCDDPGAGGRLGEAVRSALSREIRGWQRSDPGAVLVEVRGDSWDHAPELASAGPGGHALDHDTVSSGYQSLVASLFGVSCPVVVSLSGRVSGFGLALAMAADVRLGTVDTALRVGDAGVAGLLGGVSWLVSRAAGSALFAQLAWTGRELAADEACRYGLLSAVGDAATARELADRLADDAAASSALKRAVNSRLRSDLGTVLDYEAWLADVAAGGQA
jgi:enoyl-CoA hydratase/carnithine racemase